MRDSHLAPSGATAELAIGAISALFRDHHGELVRLALLTVGDLPTSEGPVQDVYASLHTRWDKASGWDAPRAHVKKDADLHVPIWLQGTQPVQTRYQLKLVNPYILSHTPRTTSTPKMSAPSPNNTIHELEPRPSLLHRIPDATAMASWHTNRTVWCTR